MLTKKKTYKGKEGSSSDSLPDSWSLLSSSPKTTTTGEKSHHDASMIHVRWFDSRGGRTFVSSVSSSSEKCSIVEAISLYYGETTFKFC